MKRACHSNTPQMKKKITIMLLLFIILSVAAQAQQPKKRLTTRDRIEQARLREIRQSLKLDQATFVRFRPVYMRYERKMSNLNLKHQTNLIKVNADTLSDIEAESMLNDQLQNAKRVIMIRERFYFECKKVLTPQQTVKLYQSETDIRKKIMNEINKRKRITE